VSMPWPLQTDGKVLIGGAFATINGLSYPRIARLNADGTLDAAYTASANALVRALALQPDGKLLVGRRFCQPRRPSANVHRALECRWHARRRVLIRRSTARCTPSPCNQDGKIVRGPASFTVTGGQAHIISPASIRTALPIPLLSRPMAPTRSFMPWPFSPDGKIIVGGGFTTMDAQSYIGLARLNANGFAGCRIPADTDTSTSMPWPFNRTARSSSAAPSPTWAVLGASHRPAECGWDPGCGLQIARRRHRHHPCSGDPEQRRILAGGDFTSIGDCLRNYIGRLVSE